MGFSLAFAVSMPIVSIPLLQVEKPLRIEKTGRTKKEWTFRFSEKTQSLNLSLSQRVISKERRAETDLFLHLLSEVDFCVKVQRRGKKDSIPGFARRQFWGGILVLVEHDGPGGKAEAEEVRKNDTKRASMMESFPERQNWRTGKTTQSDVIAMSQPNPIMDFGENKLRGHRSGQFPCDRRRGDSALGAGKKRLRPEPLLRNLSFFLWPSGALS